MRRRRRSNQSQSDTSENIPYMSLLPLMKVVNKTTSLLILYKPVNCEIKQRFVFNWKLGKVIEVQVTDKVDT